MQENEAKQKTTQRMLAVRVLEQPEEEHTLNSREGRSRVFQVKWRAGPHPLNSASQEEAGSGRALLGLTERLASSQVYNLCVKAVVLEEKDGCQV